jgi:hypothetical protein
MLQRESLVRFLDIILSATYFQSQNVSIMDLSPTELWSFDSALSLPFWARNEGIFCHCD